MVQRIGQLEETVQQLRDAIAVLKGQKPKPTIAPNRLEAPPPRSPRHPGKKRPGSDKRAQTTELTIHAEVPVPIPEAELPAGAVFLDFEPYVV